MEKPNLTLMAPASRKLSTWASLLIEALVVFLFVFTVNNYLEHPEVAIRSDGLGYYEYLPSAFIHHDLYRKDLDHVPERILSLHNYVHYQGKVLNKYPAGTALLLSPFFALGHGLAFLEGHPQDGYSAPYQEAMYYAALFYLFLGLVFLRKLLQSFDISWYVIALVQVFAVFTTSMMHYVHDEPGFSHVYSFCMVNAFLFVAHRYFRSPGASDFLRACVLFGIIVLIRQVNVLLIAVVPFIAGSVAQLRQGTRFALARPGMLFSGFVACAAFILMQMALWYAQTGHWLVYSYQGEGFNFLSPAFWDILFSYKKGLFVYTPSVFIAMLGLGVWIVHKKHYLVLTWTGFFLLLTYVLSSWWSWEYGCSYGNRAFIDFYGLFFLLLGVLLQWLPALGKLALVFVYAAFAWVSIVQTYQYKHYILDWAQMDREKYWEIFLRDDKRFRGFYNKRDYPFGSNEMLNHGTRKLGDFHVGPFRHDTVFVVPHEAIPASQPLDLLQVSFEMLFDDEQNAYVTLTARRRGSQEVLYYHEIPVLLFKEERLGSYHRGIFNYEFPEALTGEYFFQFEVRTARTPLDLKALNLAFYSFH